MAKACLPLLVKLWESKHVVLSAVNVMTALAYFQTAHIVSINRLTVLSGSVSISIETDPCNELIRLKN